MAYRNAAVIAVPGIGRFQQGMTRSLQRSVLQRLKGVRCFWQPVPWTAGVDREQDDYADFMEPRVQWDPVMRAFAQFCGDALVYDSIKMQAFREVETALERLVDKDCPVILIAHSFGGILAYEWARAHASRRLAAIVTLGTPLGHKWNYPGSNPLLPWLPRAKSALPWSNIRSLTDPIATVLARPERWPEVSKGVIEHPVALDSKSGGIGGFLQERTPLSHTLYWQSDEVADIVAKIVDREAE